jgi:hypothetical protein
LAQIRLELGKRCSARRHVQICRYRSAIHSAGVSEVNLGSQAFPTFDVRPKS